MPITTGYSCNTEDQGLYSYQDRLLPSHWLPSLAQCLLNLSLSVPLYFAGCILRLWPFFYSIFLSFFFGVGLPAYLSNHNPFSREHIFVGFNEFPSLVYWCTVIHHHRPQGPTLFRRVRWDFTCVQCYVCTYTGPPVLSPIRED